MASVGGIETRLSARSQNISKHTGEMMDRTEGVKGKWQEDKEEDLIHKISGEGDTRRSKSVKLIQEGWIG